MIMDVCLALSDQGREEALKAIRSGYPFDPSARAPNPICGCRPMDHGPTVISAWGERQEQKMRVFARDGFLDRFSGQPLIFPAVLRLLSREFPQDFPFHQYWRQGEVHAAYYELGACAAMLLPSVRGGAWEDGNLVTTTMPYLLARSDKTVDEAGWRLTREGFVDEWDGMSTWYLEYVDQNRELRNVNFFNLWYNAAKKVLRP
jgi:hypothetical protein